jgi:hypothetical protein
MFVSYNKVLAHVDHEELHHTVTEIHSPLSHELPQGAAAMAALNELRRQAVVTYIMMRIAVGGLLVGGSSWGWQRFDC